MSARSLLLVNEEREKAKPTKYKAQLVKNVRGEMSERLKEHDWNSCIRANVSRVRVPLLTLVGGWLSVFEKHTFFFDLCQFLLSFLNQKKNCQVILRRMVVVFLLQYKYAKQKKNTDRG